MKSLTFARFILFDIRSVPLVLLATHFKCAWIRALVSEKI